MVHFPLPYGWLSEAKWLIKAHLFTMKYVSKTADRFTSPVSWPCGGILLLPLALLGWCCAAFRSWPKRQTGWWLSPTPLKNMKVYESQLGWLFPIYGSMKNVPNHQPASVLRLGEPGLCGRFMRTVLHHEQRGVLSDAATAGRCRTGSCASSNLPSGSVKLAIENDHL